MERITKIGLKYKAADIAKGKAATHGREYELWMYRMTLKAMIEALRMAGINYDNLDEF